MNDLALLFFRMAFAGIMFYQHGLQKWAMLMSDPTKFADPIGIGPEASLYLAFFAEAVCALFLVFGLWTRISSSMIFFTMAVAAGIVLADQPFEKKEMALLFAAGFALIAVMGGGKYSVDSLFNRPGKRALLKPLRLPWQRASE